MARRSNRMPLSDEERYARRKADRDRLEQAARALLTTDGWQRWIRVRATNGLSRYSWLISGDQRHRRPVIRLQASTTCHGPGPSRRSRDSVRECSAVHLPGGASSRSQRVKTPPADARSCGAAAAADLLSAHSETVGASSRMPVRPRMQGWPISLPTGHARCCSTPRVSRKGVRVCGVSAVAMNGCSWARTGSGGAASRRRMADAASGWSGGGELVAVELEQVVGCRQQPPFRSDG